MTQFGKFFFLIDIMTQFLVPSSKSLALLVNGIWGMCSSLNRRPYLARKKQRQSITG
jgi:hypothetical protein